MFYVLYAKNSMWVVFRGQKFMSKIECFIKCPFEFLRKYWQTSRLLMHGHDLIIEHFILDLPFVKATICFTKQLGAVTRERCWVKCPITTMMKGFQPRRGNRQPMEDCQVYGSHRLRICHGPGSRKIFFGLGKIFFGSRKIFFGSGKIYFLAQVKYFLAQVRYFLARVIYFLARVKYFFGLGKISWYQTNFEDLKLFCAGS